MVFKIWKKIESFREYVSERVEDINLEALKVAELCVERGEYDRARGLIEGIGNPYQEMNEKDMNIINRINRVSTKLFDVMHSER